MIRRPPGSTLFPNPRLFRSLSAELAPARASAAATIATIPPSFAARPFIFALLAADGRERPEYSPFFRRRVEAREKMANTRRSEEHTSELQSPDHLVCRLLLQ